VRDRLGLSDESSSLLMGYKAAYLFCRETEQTQHTRDALRRSQRPLFFIYVGIPSIFIWILVCQQGNNRMRERKLKRNGTNLFTTRSIYFIFIELES
jgi:hypothetical protein